MKTIYLSRPSISSIWSGGAGKMALTWGKLAGVYGYEIYFSQNSSFSSARGYRITPYSKTSTTFTGLTRGKTYYVRMRCIKIPNTSTRYYSDWSPVRTVKIK
ncbi:MAG: fibronectin type III domain-containing protein [Lachnospiraceae bacterium]|nr:fibronectin type III domain-containing protein [Lachnospiraceae bacterium]